MWERFFDHQFALDLHSLGIIHTDLKLDNVAVKYSETTTVRWLDPLTGFQDKVSYRFSGNA